MSYNTRDVIIFSRGAIEALLTNRGEGIVATFYGMVAVYEQALLFSSQHNI